MDANINYEKCIKELIARLNEASREYYANNNEIMDNFTYDKLYTELEELENISGIHMSDSPTAKVGYEAVDELPKITHESPMLSLDKTKDVDTLRSFIGKQKTLLSWKMDGLTVVLTYRDKKLSAAVTRGNGYIGELVTNNARVFKGVPLEIPFEGELVLRGEAYITYSDFEKINTEIEDVDAKYKNPRNLCSGSVRQLSNEVTAARNVRFKAFSLVKAENVEFNNSHEAEFVWLRKMGFDVVEYKIVTSENLDEAMKYFSDQVKKNDFPSDGLVALYDDIKYGNELGQTAKFPRNAYAFKWADEIRSTHLKEIEWSPSRSGLINPIAVFDPVELEGTTVSRASLHNISILRNLKLGIGDEITVYKANMIIPQLAQNLTCSDTVKLPDICPACRHKTRLLTSGDVQTLICENTDCPAKKIKSFELFVSRDAMNIEGMSEATLEKFISHGMIHEFSDIFKLDNYKEDIVKMDGFGEKSYEKLINAIDKAKHTNSVRLLYAMGIPNIGLASAKLISEYFEHDINKIKNASFEELCQIDGIGDIIAQTYVAWWSDEINREQFERLLKVVKLDQIKKKEINESIAGKVFVITGSLSHFNNRNELKELIENSGGKVTGSVSAKTDYLINNDVTSGSSKNKKAAELQIPIISEEDFLNLIKTGDK